MFESWKRKEKKLKQEKLEQEMLETNERVKEKASELYNDFSFFNDSLYNRLYLDFHSIWNTKGIIDWAASQELAGHKISMNTIIAGLYLHYREELPFSIIDLLQVMNQGLEIRSKDDIVITEEKVDEWKTVWEGKRDDFRFLRDICVQYKLNDDRSPGEFCRIVLNEKEEKKLDDIENYLRETFESLFRKEIDIEIEKQKPERDRKEQEIRKKREAERQAELQKKEEREKKEEAERQKREAERKEEEERRKKEEAERLERITAYLSAGKGGK